MSSCIQCTKQFEHTQRDLEFYAKHDFLAPVLCPACRSQRRCAYRNERTLYSSTCDLCKKDIITHFSGDESFPVYCPECWWSDKWDGLKYGCDFDFSRPFFEQFYELQQNVPRLSLNNAQHENSDYCNQCIRNKNSYLLFAADDNEDSMYSYWINRCTDTFNSSNLADCTLCFDCLDSENCYHCIYSQDMKDCSDCYFSFNLIGCKNCLGCSGLRNKEYCIRNKEYSKDVFEETLKTYNLGNYSNYRAYRETFLTARRAIPHKYAHILNSENCTGDYISSSKSCTNCFDILEAEDCTYAFNLVHKHFNNRDVNYATESRNIYEMQSTIGEELYFGTTVWFSSNCWYSDLLQTCTYCFGCSGLKRQNYCILNKQYTKKEYEALVQKIASHMQHAKEWGSFFPVKYAPFAYNETVAQDFYPLTKEEVLKRGWKWKDEDTKNFQQQIYTIPYHINDVADDICENILSCATCGRNFKILPYELQIYKQNSYPVPRACSECRFQERLKLCNPRILYKRTCQKCGCSFKSTYAPERPEKVYCEACYLQALY